jgi:hypothetical protein
MRRMGRLNSQMVQREKRDTAGKEAKHEKQSNEKRKENHKKKENDQEQ